MSDQLQQPSAIENVAVPPQAPAEEAVARTLERQQAMVAMGRRAIALPDLAVLMEDSASLIADMLKIEYKTRAELSGDDSELTIHLAKRVKGDEADEKLVCHTIPADADSLAGYALEVGHPVFTGDLALETRFKDPLLSRHGIASALAVPLRLQRSSFGALLACSNQRERFQPEDILFVESIAHLVTTTIARSRSEKTLADQRRMSDGVLHTVDALVLVLDMQGRIVDLNRACQHATGFMPKEVRERAIWNVFLTPEDTAQFHEVLNRLQKGESPVGMETNLLTKHSDQRRVSWTFASLADADGVLTSIAATGVDISLQRQAEERAERAEKVADNARQAVNDLITCPPEQREARLAEAAKSLMANRQSATDADGEAVGPNQERRSRPRRTYPYRQQIASIFEGELPKENQFYEVECHDIGPGGFSFFSPRRPPTNDIVVALGTGANLTYLTAKIVHARSTEHGGRQMQLLGCAYTGRIAY